MRDTVRCPSCKAVLVVPPGLTEGDATCPRCLAQVPLPRTELEAVGIQAQPPQPRPLSPEGRGEEDAPRPLSPAGRGEEEPPAPLSLPPPPAETARPARSHCPRCGKEVQPGWLFCPHCEEPLRENRFPPRKGTLDHDVRRDTKGASVVFGLLAVLGGIGVFWYFAVALSQHDAPAHIIGGVLLLLLAALISTALMFYRTRHDPAKRSVGRVVVGTLGVVGTVLAAGCTLATAVFLFAFVVCLSGGFRFR